MGATLSRLYNTLFGYRHRSLKFAYHKPLGPFSIRLLTIVRPKWYTSNLVAPKLRINTYSLDNLPNYVALSYTWGPAHDAMPARGYDEGDKVPVLLNERSFPIFPNLMDALYALRRIWDFDDDVQHLWIDAICINQQDLAERAAQVEIMNQVYKRASSTVVWLGKGDSQTKPALRLYESILRTTPEDFAPYYQQYPNISPPPDAFWHARGLPSPHDEKAWAPLVRIFENRWFSRTWVIQEVTLSKKIIILWGSSGMTWDSMWHVALAGRAARLGQAQALPTLTRYLSGNIEQTQSDNWVVHDPLANILQLWGNRHRYLQQSQAEPSDAFINEMKCLCGSSEATESSWLVYLSLINRWAGATDPRDKVFGHLGLLRDITGCTETSTTFHATYSHRATSSHIYEQLMRNLVQDTDSLAVLMAINDPPFLRDQALPSWVPDLSRQQGLDLMWSIRPQFCAYGYRTQVTHLPDTPKVRVEEQRIHINGTALGVVSLRSCSLVDLIGQSWHTWSGHLLETNPTYLLTGEPRVEAFWRTLLMNSVARRSPADPATGEFFRAFVLQCLSRYFPGTEACSNGTGKMDIEYLDIVDNINDLAKSDSSGHMPSFLGLNDLVAQLAGVTEDEVPSLTNSAIIEALASCVEKMSTFLSGLDSSMVNRRFVISDQGHYINAPMWTEVGDIIVVLDSCPCPLVLRRDQFEPPCYKIIGSAYVHGIMYGEVVCDETKWEGYCIK